MHFSKEFLLCERCAETFLFLYSVLEKFGSEGPSVHSDLWKRGWKESTPKCG